ncbi:Aldose reductase A [Gracilariopsis chorda]|uniref:Aldose reductase A n=1 Tax=Gracilariopsis chorda TaxID=448386 RepID=A0A2V3IQT4_9FLOR|nr:Aldose reductase A [Gracilariopsis chorda]|eukprot:PXF44472.1 Aldose reductase A [Gracilariopsis chorda]
MAARSATHVLLPSGKRMPLHGFGTWKAERGETKRAVLAALNAGYRHIDCAAVYFNEKEVGQALKEWFATSGVSRSELFVTSKVWNTCHATDDVVSACKQSLSDLGVEYVDLYLVHHPYAWKFHGLPISENNWVLRDDKGDITWADGVTLQDTWRGLEKCVHLRLVRDIGVSNYPAVALMDALQYARIKPAVNQCEAHCYYQRKELRDVCARFGVHLSMYSVLGSGKRGPLQDAVVARIGREIGATPAQVLIAWGLHTGCSVLAKSANAGRIAQNFGAQRVALSAAQLRELDALDRGLMTCNMVEYWAFPSHA